MEYPVLLNLVCDILFRLFVKGFARTQNLLFLRGLRFHEFGLQIRQDLFNRLLPFRLPLILP